MLDQQYSLRAKEVGTGAVTTAKQLRDRMTDYVPTDTEFEEAIAVARVSRTHLARYYLRALENANKGISQPEFVANDDIRDINLEHVLPAKPGPDWDIDADVAEAAYKLLGNMALLKEADNRKLGNAGFAEKKSVLAQSGYDLTKWIAEAEAWGIDEIRQRQRRLAALATKHGR